MIGEGAEVLGGRLGVMELRLRQYRDRRLLVGQGQQVDASTHYLDYEGVGMSHEADEQFQLSGYEFGP